MTERIILIQDLVEGVAAEQVPFELTSTQKAQLDRRIEDSKRNPQAGVPWNAVLADALKRCGQ